MQKKNPPRRPAVSFTLADRLVAGGQHLRVSETITQATVRLTMAAQWAQARRSGGAR